MDSENTTRIHDDITGEDFGKIVVSMNTLDLIKANRLNAIDFKHWHMTMNPTFEHYFLLGMPFELIAQPKDRGKAMVTVVCFELEKMDNDRTHDIHRFKAKIKLPPNVTKIEGVSGAPIIGVNVLEDRIEYMLVAIETSWIKETSTVFGHYMLIIGNTLIQNLPKNN